MIVVKTVIVKMAQYVIQDILMILLEKNAHVLYRDVTNANLKMEQNVNQHLAILDILLILFLRNAFVVFKIAKFATI